MNIHIFMNPYVNFHNMLCFVWRFFIKEDICLFGTLNCIESNDFN